MISLSLPAATGAWAASLQPIGNFDQPIYVTSDPGNPDRLFVVEREGRIELVENGIVSPFADLSSAVSCCEGERGLLSMALAPDFDATGRFYVDYTGKEEPGEIHVAELRAAGNSPAIGTLRNVLTIPHPGQSNHNGGQLQFGPDGDLYISTGDGGSGNDELHNAQDLSSLLGKILRIRPNPEGPKLFYTVPPGDPFPGATPPANTIWSYGLRNPFRFSFDRLTGDMVIGDVGQGEREEVDLAPSLAPGVVGGAGANYGWNCREGSIEGPATDLGCATPPHGGFVEPVFDYPHTPDPNVGGESRCAIIGGYVVRDPGLGALYGRYLYADLCSGAIRSLQLPPSSAGSATGDCWTGLDVSNPVSFGEDSAGRVYVVAQGGGVYRISGLASAACPTTPHLTPFVGIKPQRRRVERGKVALLTVWVSPCDKRKGKPVKLLRNGHANGSRFLSRACTARFLPRVRRGTTFTAAVPEDGEYLPAESRHLKIRIAHHHRRHR
ncbi:MAG TPA: PQQ-dependent sugar dehydrogenase [Solirubrobacterales bacterium]|nr:PQQ-dependent sugar dehydrogenase [Solirubrobacterales bacterium]